MRRVLGIPVEVDVSWAFISALVGATFFLRAIDSGDSATAGLVVAVVGSALFTLGVLLHEVSHAVVARRRGIAVRRVRLFPFGGFTEMEVGPADGAHESAVALAGPLASFGAAAVLWGARWAADGWWDAASDALGLLALVNLALAGFNLLPGLPLDGGRVLRAVLARRLGDSERATRVAADAGRVIGAALALSGPVVGLRLGVAVAVWNVVVGWFLYRVASEARPGTAAGALAAVPGRPVPPQAGPEEIEAARGTGAYVPVVAGGRVVGVIPPGGPIGPGTAGDVMLRLRRRDLVAPGDRVGRVARRPRIVVAGGRMVGVIPHEPSPRIG